MATTKIKYVCDFTGKEFNTEEEAVNHERAQRAMQYLRDRCGIDADQAEDVLCCIEQAPHMFDHLIPQPEDIS